MSHTLLNVFNIQHYSLQDGPGIRTTVFLKGCPLRCRWCCNPESQNTQPEQMGKEIVGKMLSVEDILKEVEKDEVFYHYGEGGMTVSGGEPLMQGEAVIELLKEARHRYISTTIETSGFAPEHIVLEAGKYLKTIYFDIKSMNARKHQEWTGVSNEKIIQNFKLLRTTYPEKNIIVRTPVIPGFNDDENDILQIREFLEFVGQKEYELLPYHKFGKPKYEKLGRKYLMEE